MKKFIIATLAITGFLLVSCAPNAEQLKKVIEENPDIVFKAIEKDPVTFFKTIEKAQNSAREAMAKSEEEEAAKKLEEEAKKLEEEFKNPIKPNLDNARTVFGSDSAQVTIVEYSDFQCPYCAKAFREALAQVKSEYKDQVRIVYKHLPLPMHPMAVPAAKYFEAIWLQDAKKAAEFHDELYKNLDKINSEGENYFKAVAKKLGVNMSKLAKDVESAEVAKRVDEDKAEADKFGFSGTPGFVINGVTLRGAYPFSFFKKIIDRHLGK